VLYSDGLVENRIRGLDAGLNELVAVAARARGGVVGHPERMLSYLVDAMLAGHEQDDDVTVLVLHVPPRDVPEGDAPIGTRDRTPGEKDGS
jgi:serine phosphatase RsbU (regulator of sigma subunit)